MIDEPIEIPFDKDAYEAAVTKLTIDWVEEVIKRQMDQQSVTKVDGLAN